MNIFFSIIIPLYNKQDSIRKTLRSVLDQEHDAFEIVIVDDGSTDKSIEAVLELKDARIRLIRQPNSGVSAARNKGIYSANHVLLAFLDADDFWEPDYLSQMAALINDFPDAAMYGCAFDEINLGSKYQREFGLENNFRGYVNNYFYHARKSFLFSSSATIINGKLVKNIGYFDERISLGEDIDLWFRIAFQHKVVFYNSVLVHYNTGAANRAMCKKHNFSQSLLCYFPEYKELETSSEEFRLFINFFKIQKIPELFLNYQIGIPQIRQYLKGIQLEGQTWKARLFVRLPYLLQKLAVRIFRYKKHRI